MDSYLDLLKKRAASAEAFGLAEIKPAETVPVSNPCILTMVTLGKELHAGHLLLLGVADQMRRGLGGLFPQVLINNNTGPRAAAALCRLAADRGLDLETAATVLDQGRIPVPEVVRAYRSRSESDTRLPEAVDLLAGSGLDIFSANAEQTTLLLGRAGFNIQIIPESRLLLSGRSAIDTLSPSWSGTGFTPFVTGRRAIILEKSGRLTAAGSVFTTLSALTGSIQPDFLLAVDSQPDSSDGAVVFSAANKSASGDYVPGAGVGFRGRIASGTSGEAMTIREIISALPAGSVPDLRQAVSFFLLTRPVSLPAAQNAALTESFYDFADNDSLVRVLVESAASARQFSLEVTRKQQELLTKISSGSRANTTTSAKLLEFLPQRLQALLNPNPREVISSSRKVIPVTDPARKAELITAMGYDPDSPNPYRNKVRQLGMRQNFFFNRLNNLLESADSIESLTPGEYASISAMIQFCLNRTGL